MKLAQALRLLPSPDLHPGHPPTSAYLGNGIAFVGAGGKTTALFQLARELPPVIVNATTHLGVWQSLADRQSPQPSLLEAIEHGLSGVIWLPARSTVTERNRWMIKS
jgi:hypothetical protein